MLVRPLGPRMKAKDLMTRVVLSVDKDDRLESVLDTMRKHRVSKLVVTEKKLAEGVVTDGDIADELGAIKNRGVPASHLHASSAMRKRFVSVSPEAEAREVLDLLRDQDAGIVPVLHERMPVGVITASDLLPLVKSAKPLADVMTTQLHVVSPADRVVHARRTMLDHHVERLPVIESPKLVGIVGEIDIAIGLARFKDTVADHHQPAAIQRFLVQDVMVRDLVTATPETTANEAVKTMREQDVGSLPVLRAGRLVGIVTRSDLLSLISL
jgi:CBS domain-containing protein